MNAETESKLAELLAQAGSAHGRYEESELGGVYDQQWPAWYAAYLVEHGIGDMVGRTLAAGSLAELLRASDQAYKRERPAESWPAYYARRIAADDPQNWPTRS